MLHLLQTFEWPYCLFLSEHFLNLLRQGFSAVFGPFQHLILVLVFVYMIQDIDMLLIFRTYTLLELKEKEWCMVPATII